MNLCFLHYIQLQQQPLLLLLPPLQQPQATTLQQSLLLYHQTIYTVPKYKMNHRMNEQQQQKLKERWKN